MSNIDKITKEISTIDVTLFLVRGDGKEMFLVDTEQIAKDAICSLAAHDSKIYKKKRTNVYLETLEDGHKIIISTQKLGKYMYNSSPVVRVVFDFIPVKKAVVKTDRLVLPSSSQIESFVKSERKEVQMV